jgi:lipopolysaccharide transport system ATP-binding protein
MSGEVLIKAERLGKKYCRSLKRSLWYGVKDVTHSLLSWSVAEGQRAAATAVGLPELRKDEFWAIRDVSFEVRRGQCLGLVGHNGAGKSTLLKILNSLNRPDAGQVTLRGRVGALIELSAGLNPILTGRENIYNQAALLGFTNRQTQAKFDAIVEFSELEDFLDMPLQNYSSGMKVRLGFAVCSQMEPDVLLIDEVLAVGDVAFRFKCLNAIGELMKRSAVIFVTHAMPQVHRICNDIIVLNHGSVAYQGSDIAQGVREYMSLFRGGEQTVAGTGEAKVLALRMSNQQRSAGLGETLEADFGSPLTITARVKIEGAHERLRLEFLLWNAEMLPVMELMTEDLLGCPFDVPPSSEVEITAHVPRLEINSGQYTLSIIVTDMNHSQVQCRHGNAAFLKVHAATPSGAHMISVADWSIRTCGSRDEVVALQRQA